MLLGLALIALAATTWGTTGSVITVLVERAGADPLLVGAVRMGVGAALLLAAAAIRGPLRVPPGARLPCLAMGACMAAFQATYFTAVTLAGIAVTALVAICSAPLIIAAIATATLGERLSRRAAAALALGVLGTALLLAGPRRLGDFTPRFVGGALLALGAGLSYALYVVIAKASLRGAAPLPLTAFTFATAAVLSTPLLAWTDAPGRQIALGWPWLLYLGAVTTAGAYTLYSLGLRRVSASVCGIASLLEPLTASVLGALVFGERLGAAGVAGALLLFAAIGLLVRDQSGPSR